MLHHGLAANNGFIWDQCKRKAHHRIVMTTLISFSQSLGHDSKSFYNISKKITAVEYFHHSFIFFIWIVQCVNEMQPYFIWSTSSNCITFTFHSCVLMVVAQNKYKLFFILPAACDICIQKKLECLQEHTM